MAQEIAISRFLLDIIPIASSSVNEDELVNHFTKSVSVIFGIDSVAITDIKHKENVINALEGYIRNTKKSYVDNQLSEYSAFPELIEYRNRGFRSCAVLPLIVDGRVFSLLELLSVSENKFTDELVNSVAFGASFMGFVLMYKGELGRSVRLATYFDAAFNNPVPQFIVSDDGAVVKANKAAMKSFDTAPPSDKKRIEELLTLRFQDLMKLTNGTYVNITLGAGANGSGKANARVYTVVASRINDKMMHVAANDITDQFANAAVNELIDKNSEVCAVIADSKFTITNMSLNAERLFGYSKNVLVTGNFLDLISKNIKSDFKDRLQELEKKPGSAVSGNVVLEFPEKGTRYFNYTARKFLDGFVMLLVSAEMERYVENTRRDLEDFIGNSSDVVLGVDGLGYIRDCNIAAEAVTGFRKEELIGRDVKSLYQDHSILDRDLNYVRNKGKVDHTAIDIVSKSMELVPATHSIRWYNGAPDETGVEFIILLKELSTKRKLSDLSKRVEDLGGELKDKEAEGQLKSQFILNISHELKTPLTNIKGYSKLLYDGEFGPLNEEQKGYIKTTLDEADRLMLVIQQVLDAAKLESKKVKLEFKDVDLRNMENNPSIQALRESAVNKGLEFEWHVDFDVPEKVSADPNRLIQVFVNLVGNSIKFTEKGSIKVQIGLNTSKNGTKNKRVVKCRIVDTGIGISEDDRKKLFKKKFYEATKKGLVQQPGAGTGLGLSITKDIVNLHEGKVGCESKQGEGSVFWFTIPTSQKPKRREQQQEDKKQAQTQAQQPSQQ